MNSATTAAIIEGAILAAIGLYFTLRGHGMLGVRVELDAIKAENEEKGRLKWRILGPIIILLAVVITIMQLSNPAAR